MVGYTYILKTKRNLDTGIYRHRFPIMVRMHEQGQEPFFLTPVSWPIYEIVQVNKPQRIQEN